MGIGNASQVDAIDISGRTSLPLMGIGNLEAAVGEEAEALRAVSLPLMGIGNLVEHLPPCPAVLVSLPLMGIGNGGRASSTTYGRPLITPHGDRKRSMRCQRRAGDSDSLPLMGIGNLAYRREQLARIHARHSLPLMGIGNASRRHPRQQPR